MPRQDALNGSPAASTTCRTASRAMQDEAFAWLDQHLSARHPVRASSSVGKRALAGEDSQAAQLIQLRYFGGLSLEDAAEVVGLSRSRAYEHWAYARVRLRCLLRGE
jgi:DNA-directed RNA polymerase specialized sigma24 family protein